MKWNPEDEIEFIVRKLNHELTTAEERQFQCWLAEDQAHRSLFQEIESISLRSKEAKIVFEPDIELALQKVKSRRARMERLRHRIWQYAALILVALGLGIYGTYRFADRLDEVTDGVDAGSSRAILHLASGEKIVLGEEIVLTKAEQEEVKNHAGKWMITEIAEHTVEPYYDILLASTTPTRINKDVPPKN